MHPKRKQKLIMALIIITGSTLAVLLALFALSKNIDLYYTPTQIANHEVPLNTTFRMGGIVKDNSIKYGAHSLSVNFILTDKIHDIPVEFTGVLPDLFRQGQGIVTQGKLTSSGIFIADQVLAKHSATYMPPAVKDALKAAKNNRNLYN